MKTSSVNPEPRRSTTRSACCARATAGSSGTRDARAPRAPLARARRRRRRARRGSGDPALLRHRRAQPSRGRGGERIPAPPRARARRARPGRAPRRDHHETFAPCGSSCGRSSPASPADSVPICRPRSSAPRKSPTPSTSPSRTTSCCLCAPTCCRRRSSTPSAPRWPPGAARAGGRHALRSAPPRRTDAGPGHAPRRSRVRSPSSTAPAPRFAQVAVEQHAALRTSSRPRGVTRSTRA